MRCNDVDVLLQVVSVPPAELLNRVGKDFSELDVDLAQLLRGGLVAADDVEDGLLDGLGEFDVVELLDLEVERVVWGFLGEVAENTIDGVHRGTGVESQYAEGKALARRVSVGSRRHLWKVYGNLDGRITSDRGEKASYLILGTSDFAAMMGLMPSTGGFPAVESIRILMSRVNLLLRSTPREPVYKTATAPRTA